ncbi:PaaI family thioesterase [Alkalihalobacterium chitinilyticum]|uniref:PaaI family thioesterase n=1 Tax=Alkalihalobacterium chitinilyticum TaxID=2980103 RepID=A0ABT5VF69_9BACI|nr:PaaI family thioesterase [Alkalihalobacterium chitinilyticum]MDE5413337.1 PaaI family thioesterase [Alkalihalobacterium chitinilyticum]
MMLLEEIMDDLQDLSSSELEEVHRVIKSYKGSLMKTEEGWNLHYYGRFIGIDQDENGREFMRLGAFNENTYGVTQGGALYTFADVSIGKAILTNYLKDGEKVFTLEMKMNFIKGGTGEKLYAKTNFLHKGSTTIVAQCNIEDENEILIAHALATFYIVKPKK